MRAKMYDVGLGLLVTSCDIFCVFCIILCCLSCDVIYYTVIMCRLCVVSKAKSLTVQTRTLLSSFALWPHDTATPGEVCAPRRAAPAYAQIDVNSINPYPYMFTTTKSGVRS